MLPHSLKPRDRVRPRLGVILVNYRSADDVAARLASGALNEAAVVLVDNASDPERMTALAWQHHAAVVLLPTNIGFAGGVSAGVLALGEVDRILLLNPDASVTATQLEALGAALVDGIDGVAPLLVDPAGIDQVGAAGGPVTLRSTMNYFLGVAHLFPAAQSLFLTRRQARASTGTVDWLCAACLLVRGDVFTRWGNLPTDELVYAEDLAWGTQATQRGARFALVSSVQVRHEVGGSGSGELWVGALTRLLRHRLGPVRGLVAIASVRTGLLLRIRLGAVTRMLRAHGR